ncbi:hypothetical protein PC116_g27508 [Phytophthora cactorum]|uniref:Uncharacterized protein n=1 Tax=Phytophthora cactorum TaxID=29920 RepID=A0A8T0Y0P4_9STRA|nr:hypothetical protein PC113_g23090 [Phytophthora cactorum]KAG2963548.1 hypothetical protein PC119_g25482 [Phytophthora cactorum]KAG4224033.1 hypothetical protein PC116_g27508 [Phytophthora cactorum]
MISSRYTNQPTKLSSSSTIRFQRQMKAHHDSCSAPYSTPSTPFCLSPQKRQRGPSSCPACPEPELRISHTVPTAGVGCPSHAIRASPLLRLSTTSPSSLFPPDAAASCCLSSRVLLLLQFAGDIPVAAPLFPFSILALVD